MKAFTLSGPGPVPRLLLWASVVVLVASTVLLVAGACSIGVTWDEPYHVERWRNYSDHGWYVIDAQSFGGKPFAGVTDQYVYAPATMGFLHLWNMLFGVDSAGHVSTTASGYLTRHLGIAFLGLLALAGMVVLGRLVLRRWDWGIVAAACLASIPMWTGHAMFNLKDIPVGTGYIWFTVGLCLLARRERGSARLRCAAILAVAAGSFLMIGTRPGMWTASFCSIVALLVMTLLRERQERVPLGSTRWRYLDLGVGLAVAYAGLVLLYPRAFLHPIHTAYTSAASSSSFLDIESSRGFTPVHVLLQMPSLLLCFVVIGTVGALLRMRRTIRHVDVGQVRLALVGVQLLTLPLITVVKPSPLYGDLRQLLFAAPAAALLAAVGIASVAERVRAGIERFPLGLVSGISVVALAVPLVAQAALFPFSYTYYNGLIDLSGVNPSTEYYRASGRALVPELPATGRVVCSPLPTVDGNAIRLSHLDGARDCRTSLISPIAAFADDARGDQAPLGPDQFWLVNFTPGDPPKNCTAFDRVSRRGLFGSKQFSLLARCTAKFPTLTREGIRFGDTLDPMWGVFDEGWYLRPYSPRQVGLRAFSTGASLGFRLPPANASTPVEIRTTTAMSTADLRLLVDGRDASFSPLAGGPGVRVLVPPTGTTHHLELRGRRGTGLFFVITGIRIGPAAAGG